MQCINSHLSHCSSIWYHFDWDYCPAKWQFNNS